MILFFAGTETYKSFIESEILQFQGLLNLNRCAVLYSKQVSSYFAMTVIVLHKKSFLPHYFENIIRPNLILIKRFYMNAGSCTDTYINNSDKVK